MIFEGSSWQSIEILTDQSVPSKPLTVKFTSTVFPTERGSLPDQVSPSWVKSISSPLTNRWTAVAEVLTSPTKVRSRLLLAAAAFVIFFLCAINCLLRTEALHNKKSAIRGE